MKPYHWTGKRGCGLYGYHHKGRRRMDAMVSREWYGWAVVLMVNPATGRRWTIKDGKRFVERLYGGTK